MKNQYIGDVNDFRKYGLLRILSNGGDIRTGVCWMLTPNDNRNDGLATQYLLKPKQFYDFDPELFKTMEECMKNNMRTVGYIENSGILPNAIFYNHLLANDSYTRKLYMEDMLSCLEETDLIFFDPDNGIEVKSRRYGHCFSSKYVYWSELESAFTAGKSLLVYQHFTRENREQFINRLVADCHAKLKPCKVITFKTPHVVYFLVLNPANAHKLIHRSRSVSERWQTQIDVSSHYNS
jgi:hypothetical protein